MSGTPRMAMFEHQMSALRCLARHHPRWVGVDELSEMLYGTTRTQQRVLKALSELGYLERAGTNPAGFRILPEKFEEFKGL